MLKLSLSTVAAKYVQAKTTGLLLKRISFNPRCTSEHLPMTSSVPLYNRTVENCISHQVIPGFAEEMKSAKTFHLHKWHDNKRNPNDICADDK